MAAAIAAYQAAITTTRAKLHNIGKPAPSMADAIVIAGLMGLAKCSGPVIAHTPGLLDTPVANRANLLPDKDETMNAILAKMARSSFTPAETVALVGAGHTISKLNGRALDATFDKFDNRFFVELAAGTGQKLPSDLAMLGNNQLLQSILLFAQNETAFVTQATAAIQKMIALKPAVIPKPCFLGIFCRK